MAISVLLAAGVFLTLIGIFTGTFPLIGLGVAALVVAAVLETYSRTRPSR